MRVLLYFVIIFFPLAAQATEVKLIMTNFIQKTYLPTTTGHAVYFKIKGKKHTQSFSKMNVFSYWSKKDSKQKNIYENGSLIFKDSIFNFKHAYYYKGELILQNVLGNISGKSMQSKEIKFSKVNHKITAKRIIFSEENSFMSRVNYQLSIPPPF